MVPKITQTSNIQRTAKRVFCSENLEVELTDANTVTHITKFIINEHSKTSWDAQSRTLS